MVLLFATSKKYEKVLFTPHTVQAVRNITLISEKRTKTKSCELVRTFSNISEFAINS